jgi:predicted solute-binding protein
MRFALAHRAEALAFAARFGRGDASRHREDFVDKFANADTVSMPEDVRSGLAELYRRAFDRGLIDHVPVHEVI